jgi:hypothetical protein
MATSKTCDRCGSEASTEVEVKGKDLTAVKVDLCQECFEQVRWFVHWLTGQDAA